MRVETLISQAGYAIDIFKIDHVGSCCLCIKNGFVKAFPAIEVSRKVPVCLLITPIEQKRGLTVSRWKTIGDSLFVLYNKEKSCHEPPKP